MKKIIGCLVFLLMIYSDSVVADKLYEWTDEDGIKHYSTKVPDMEREKRLRQKRLELEQKREDAKKRKLKKGTQKQKKKNEHTDKWRKKMWRALSHKKYKDRYKFYDNDIVVDTQTGLMWDLLNSRYRYYKAMDHKHAKWYVKGLRTGGYKDWRMPTPQELALLYGEQPIYPADEIEWFWTGKSFWWGKEDKARVITPGDYKIEYRNTKWFGAVHPVRK